MNPLTKQPKKDLLLFALLIFCGLTTNSKLFAQGPNAPEASSFEPVDATDMVNLVTGDLTYVLPLLNIPSPEGGYPIALSYHAGIAMDQEASWVGLGWSLNPGSINRSINGFPDDWGNTTVNEFFYDEGWSEDHYNFTIGGTLPNGIYLGVSSSWGSNKSFGGTVSFGYAGIVATIGTKGQGGGVGIQSGLLNAGVNTSGFNFGIGGSLNGTGLGMNFNSQRGIGGFISSGLPLNSSLGLSFNSNGVIASGSFMGAGGGSYSNSNSETGDLSIKTRGLNLDFGLFHVGYSHTEVDYSLFSFHKLKVSGILYPYQSKKNIDGAYHNISNTSNTLHDNHFMDVYSQDFGGQKNTLLPNYDNYNVNAQGLSGLIKPRIFKEVNLYGRGSGDVKYENGQYVYSKRYLSSPTNNSGDSDYNIGSSKESFFYFENSLNSFLRINSGGIINSNGFTNISDFNVFNNIHSESDNSFSSVLTPNGNIKRNGLRKREGNFIEIFTNEQIKNNTVTGLFIEAKGVNRNNDNTFINDGIGAYRITSVDGKIYHYSLPVYQFESFMKNFNNEDNTGGSEEVAFFESMKEKQYATHWLLTAITGPDYIDVNNNGILDETDYGYWVEFEYGKWTDGYGWRTPKVGYHTIKTRDVLPQYCCDKYGHTYSWGRKQVYYLDAIKTRTHTALFVKDLRDDSESYVFNVYDNKIVNNNFNIDYNCKGYSSNKLKEFGYPNETFYKLDGTSLNLPSTVNRWYARQENLKYIEIPKNKSLKLSKILLIKNKNLSYNKTLGNLTNPLTGYSHFNNKYFMISTSSTIGGLGWSAGNLYDKQNVLNSFQIHQHQNVLDVKDITNQGLDAISEKVINFNYAIGNNLLAKNTPNSSSTTKGRLTLNGVSLSGKEGVQLIPSYKFNYNSVSISYNQDDTDEWGYHKNYPNAWSLNEITTPLGSKINIEYESDSFYTEAAYTEPDFEKVDLFRYNGNSIDDSQIESFTRNNEYITIYFKEGTLQNNLNTYYNLGQIAHFTYNYYANDNSFLGYTYGTINDSYIIDSMFAKDWIRFKITSETLHHHKFPDSNSNCYAQGPVNYWGGPLSLPEGSICAKYMQVKLFTGGYTYNNPNGKLGGGLRAKSVSLLEGSNNYKTKYLYSNPLNGNISGITSYFPSDSYPIKTIKYASELPAPEVMYEYVTVSSENNGIYNGKTRYKFNVLRSQSKSYSERIDGGSFYRYRPFSDILYEETYRNSTWMIGGYNQVEVSKATIYNNIAEIGRLESVKIFNSKDQLFNNTTNNYKSEYDDDGELGVIQETFKNVYKRTHFNHSTFENDYYYTSNSIVKYPSVLESTTVTQGNFTSTTHFMERDFLTGQVLETATTDSKGNEFKTELIPAYTKYGTGNYSMGSKVDNSTNRNMLIQEAMSKTYIKLGGVWKETGVGITTWNNQWDYINYDGNKTLNSAIPNSQKIWRKHKNYIWKGDLDTDGTYLGFTGPDDSFVWGLGAAQTNSKWKNTSTTTQYDHYSMPLEVMDINNNFAATKTCDKESKVLVVSNAKYTEMFYSGAEYVTSNASYFDGQVKASATNTTYAHTGARSIAIGSGAKGFEVNMLSGEHRAGKYKVSVWVEKATHANARINTKGVTKAFNGETIFAGNWVLKTHYEDLSGGAETVYVTSASGTVYFDDFRLHPIASSMVSYVYNEWDELWYLIGNNGLASKFEYDKAGRLIKTYAEIEDLNGVSGTDGFKPISENSYNYKKPI